MKLRSGKVLSTFPTKLEKTLETSLQDFRRLFSADKEHAQELLKIISKAHNIDSRFDIRDKIEEVYDNNKIPGGTGDLMSAAGDLTWLLINNSQYRDIISERIQTFELEIPLLGGDIEESL